MIAARDLGDAVEAVGVDVAHPARHTPMLIPALPISRYARAVHLPLQPSSVGPVWAVVRFSWPLLRRVRKFEAVHDRLFWWAVHRLKIACVFVCLCVCVCERES